MEVWCRRMSTESLIGEQVECFTHGATWGVGQVYGYTDAPTVMVERADGTRFSWRRDLTRVAPKPIAPKPSDLRDYLEHPGNWGTLDGRRGLLLAMLDALETTHEADTAHDVALERERVAAWLESHATCGNCDGRLCMGCIFREYDHTCAEDCPDCCEGGQMIDPGARLATRLRSGDHWKDGA